MNRDDCSYLPQEFSTRVYGKPRCDFRSPLMKTLDHPWWRLSRGVQRGGGKGGSLPRARTRRRASRARNSNVSGTNTRTLPKHGHIKTCGGGGVWARDPLNTTLPRAPFFSVLPWKCWFGSWMQFDLALHSIQQNQSGEKNMTDIIPGCNEWTSFIFVRNLSGVQTINLDIFLIFRSGQSTRRFLQAWPLSLACK